MALENLEFKDQIGLICAGRKIVKREKKRGGRGRREEEEEEEKMKKESQDQASQKGMDAWILVWKLTLIMNSMRLCMNFHALMVILLPKFRVFVRASSSPKIYVK